MTGTKHFYDIKLVVRYTPANAGWLNATTIHLQQELFRMLATSHYKAKEDAR